MVPSESAPQELSNEWSCQYSSTILNFLVNFCVPPLVTEVTIRPLKGLKKPSVPRNNIDLPYINSRKYV
jgi:hypothetical protein